MSTCASCGTAIRWVITKTGAAMPIDPGQITVLVSTGRWTQDRQGQGTPEFEVRRGYRSHFASCPFASAHRKGKGTR